MTSKQRLYHVCHANDLTNPVTVNPLPFLEASDTMADFARRFAGFTFVLKSYMPSNERKVNPLSPWINAKR